MCLDCNSGEAEERGVFGAHDRPAGRLGGGRDDEVVGTAGLPLVPDMDEEGGVRLCDVAVVVEDRNDPRDLVQKCQTGGSAYSCGQKHADPKFGERDRRDRDLVVVPDGVVQRTTRAFGIDQERGVE